MNVEPYDKTKNNKEIMELFNSNNNNIPCENKFGHTNIDIKKKEKY